MIRSLLPHSLAWIALAACTQSPQIPDLNTRPVQPIERVVLDDKLTARDVKELYRALNRGGDLSALKPWVEDPTEQELEPIVELVSRWVYEEAQADDGLLALMEERARNSTFARALSDLHSGKALALRRLIARVLRFASLPEIAERDIAFLQGNWLSLWEDARKRAGENPNSKTVSTKDLLRDLKPLLSDPSVAIPLAHLLERAERLAIPESTLLALASLNGSPGTGAFQSIESAFRRWIPDSLPETSPNVLARLTTFASVLITGSEGLFLKLQEGIHRDAKGLSTRLGLFDPLTINSISGYIREEISAQVPTSAWTDLAPQDDETPSEAFRTLFTSIRSGIELVTGVAQTPETSAEHVLTNLPIFLNALALTRWFQATAPENIGQLSDPRYQGDIWRLPWKAKGLKVQFRKTDAAGMRLTNRTLQELVVTPESFRDEVAVLAKRSVAGAFSYGFPPLDGSKTLRESLVEMVKVCQTRRQFADPSSTVRALLRQITRPEESLITLADLESDNLFDSVNRYLAAPDLKLSRKGFNLLLNDLQLDKLPSGVKEQLTSWLGDDEAYKSKLDGWLEGISLIRDLDAEIDGLPSPLLSYHRFLRSIGLDQVNFLSEAFSFFDKANLFSTTAEKNTCWRYPAFIEFLKVGDLTALLTRFSQFSPPEIRAIASPFHSMLGNRDGTLGSTLHITLARDLIEKVPQDLEEIIDSIRHSKSPLGAALSEKEKRWMVRFIESGDFRNLWNFLHRQGSKAKALELITQLQRLETDGTLAKALDLLDYIRSDRIRALSTALHKWEKLGELKALLAVAGAWVESL